MQINPGGRLSLNEVVGRDAEVKRYWSILRRQGLVLSGERRIGKTHILWKMNEEGAGGFASIYQELEGVTSTIDLVRSIYHTIEDRTDTLTWLKAKAIKAWQSILPKRLGDLELPNARDNWKPLLSSAIDDVASLAPLGAKIVLMWDEMPLMIDNVARYEGEASAMQLLDLLRHLRQMHSERVRFLFTGSIGLHLVLRDLRKRGHTNSPINDMLYETVPPLDRPAAMQLIRLLLGDLTHAPLCLEAVAESIYSAVGGFAYYIHHLADQLSTLDRPTNVDDVPAVCDALIYADSDPAHLAYYVDRIHTHYDEHDARLCLALLDEICQADEPMPMSELAARLEDRLSAVDTNEVRDACRLLCQDHYLDRVASSSGTVYAFRWPFVRDWWRKSRI